MATFRTLWFRFFSLLLFAGAGAALSACNTFHGMGQDIQNTSDTVKKAL